MRLAGVEIAAPLLGVAESDQNLPGDDFSLGERLGPDARQSDLADGGGSLAVLQF